MKGGEKKRNKMGHDGHYIYLGRLMDTKWVDRELEKIVREAKFFEIKRKVIEGFYYLIGEKR